MLTLKFKIKHCDKPELLADYVSDYTGAYYKMYNNLELQKDSTFLNGLPSKFCKYTILHLTQNVQTKYENYLATQETIKERLDSLQKELQSFNQNLTKKESRRKFKVIVKIAELSKSIGKNICFGGKNLLKSITKLDLDLKYKPFTDIERIEKKLLLQKYKLEFKQKRQIPIYLGGETLHKGNRKVNFNLSNNVITYKPDSRTKITVEFFSSKSQKKVLDKLQNTSDSCLQPLTVSISNEYVYISYDEAKLAGYAFNIDAVKRDQRKVTNPEHKKEIYKQARINYDKVLLTNKVKNRVAAVDLNPNFIGFSITDFNTNKTIFTTCYNLEHLNLKTGKSSDKNKNQTNKRKHEIIHIYKDIFKLCEHFKVSTFGLEDLNFKNKESTNTEFNRLTKNIWNRELQTNQITKYCNRLGIKLIEVIPMYSSFQGNFIFDDYDPIASSKIIAERAQNKYIKGYSIFENFNRIGQKKLNYLTDKNILECTSWQQLYRAIGSLPYRNITVNQSKVFKSTKSKILEIK